MSAEGLPLRRALATHTTTMINYASKLLLLLQRLQSLWQAALSVAARYPVLRCAVFAEWHLVDDERESEQNTCCSRDLKSLNGCMAFFPRLPQQFEMISRPNPLHVTSLLLGRPYPFPGSCGNQHIHHPT